MPCRHLRISTRVMVSCIVPLASIASAFSWSPTISSPSTVGIRSLAHTASFTVFGSAVPACVPMNLNAGPSPAITTLRDAVALDRDEAGLGQVDDNRPGNAILPLGKVHDAR